MEIMVHTIASKQGMILLPICISFINSNFLIHATLWLVLKNHKFDISLHLKHKNNNLTAYNFTIKAVK